MELPPEFLTQMKELLQAEYDEFYSSYAETHKLGLRVNTLKIAVDDFLRISPFSLTPIPWAHAGFYYQPQDRPGKHPFHEAGLYYIQEPSAMAAAEFVAPHPGEKVLDLCAAPGGKTTHLAAKMRQQGILVANEFHPVRAKILAQNVERLGITNAVVTNEPPDRLAQRFPAYFDRILVDAPCSGEGMFRKDPEVCSEWSLENVAVCANRQLDILQHAGRMLRAGGRLVYSTCTFSPEENEAVIDRFLKVNPTFTLSEVQLETGFSQGRPDWVQGSADELKKTVRLWPHRLGGEGHFIAVLEKAVGEREHKPKTVQSTVDEKALKDYFVFTHEHLTFTPQGHFLLFGEQLYLLPPEMVALENLKVVRPGWHLGTLKKGRFEPSHALALSLKQSQVKNFVSFHHDSPQLLAYVKGEPLTHSGAKGWYVVAANGYSVGWGKLVEQTLKNHYPKGLRWTGRT